MQPRAFETTLPRPLNGAGTLRDRLDEVRSRIAGAASRAGRNPLEVNLIGVTKTLPAAVAREALEEGLRDLGESKVQEARDKIRDVGRRAARWHLIGHLQRNKAGKAIELFDWIHSVDSVDLAETMARRAEASGVRPSVLLEVNVSGETSKFGISPDDAKGVARRVAGLEGLELEGLMTIAPYSDDPEAARPHFAALRELRDSLQGELGVSLPHLSMGMSGDYEVAVEEGSTMVRVGTALFGPRQ